MKVRSLLLVLVAGVIPGQDWQSRNIFHLSVPVEGRWYIPFWSITNFRAKTGKNTNLLSGIGYRGNNWWLEAMFQYRWDPKGNQKILDFRFDRQFKHWHLYAEAAPYLSKKAFYEFVILERKFWRGVSVGGETENVHQAGRDVVKAGPRLSRKLGKLGGFDVGVAGAVRMSAVAGFTEPRLYLVFNRRYDR